MSVPGNFESDAGKNNKAWAEHSELQLQQFYLVEEQLKTLGMGLNKEIATKNGMQLCENVKLIEMKEPGLSESHFGRKLYTNIRTIFTKYNLGVNLSELVETNYPIDRFIQRLQEDILGLKEKKKELEVSKVYPPKMMDQYMAFAEAEYEEMIDAERAEKAKAIERGEVPAPKRSSSKSKKKPSAAAKGELSAESEHTGDEGDDDRLAAIKKKWRLTYVKDARDYEKYQRACETVQIGAKELSETEERFLVVSILVEYLRAAGNILVQKIQGAVIAYEKIRQKLSGVVVLERTGETIANPFESNNLAGLCCILKSEYYTATLIRFNNDFSDTLRCSVPATEVLANPMKAVQLTDKRIAEWTTMHYWKYMTMDIFFVNVLLGYIPASQMKDKCVVAVEEFIEKREAVGDWNEAYSQASMAGGATTMPIYRFLAEHIRRAENSTKHRSVFGVNSVGGGNTPGGNKTAEIKGGKDHTYFGGKRYTGNVEAAAAAGTQYTTAVAREQNVITKDLETGREYPYTATKEACGVCFGKSEAGTHFSKVPSRCYKGMCRTCGLYGHKSSTCMQSPTTYVNGKPAAQGEK